MNLLQGCIAFALALAGFATLCTVLIEVFHRVAGMRSRGLLTMLHAYFKGVVAPELKVADAAADALEKDFIAKLTDNALMAQFGRDFKLTAFWRQQLLALDTLSKADFLARLPQTDAFDKLKAAAGKAEDALLQDLGASYDHYCQATTTYFKARSHLLSLLAGVALAFLGNIHAGRIFDAFVKNPDLALRMEGQADSIRAALAAVPPPPAPAAAPAPAANASPAIGEELAKIHNTLQDYQNLGLPVGWTYYPNCFGGAEADPRCAAVRKTDTAAAPCFPASLTHTAAQGPLAFIQWLCVVFVTGLLIGLGGPFWYDLAVKLSTLRALFNGKEPLAAETPSQSPQQPQTAAQPEV